MKGRRTVSFRCCPSISLIAPSSSEASESRSNDRVASTHSVLRSNGGAATSAEEAAELLKQQQAAQPVQPRPIFPWRHEPLDNPLPRLDPASSAFRPAMNYNVQRVAAYWFLEIPLWQALLTFEAWRRDLADQAGYAFQQAVFGILTNMYQLEPSSTTMGEKLQFNIEERGGGESKDKAADNDDTTIDSSPPANGNQKHPAFGGATEQQSEQSSDTATTTNETEKDEITTTTSPSSSAKTDGDDDSSKKDKKDNNTTEEAELKAEDQKMESKDESKTESQSESSESKASNDDTSSSAADKLDLNEMIIRPLKNLYESAHQSGRDQLLIRLQMEPVSAHLLNIVCFPYVTREEFASNPDKVRDLRGIRSLPSRDAFNKVLQMLEADLQRHGKLETTVEVQVLVVCREIFQVVDRASGQVLQGSEDASEREVGHLVRFETTAVQEYQPDSRTFTNYKTNWQITDIDDLLSPTAWYEK